MVLDLSGSRKIIPVLLILVLIGFLAGLAGNLIETGRERERSKPAYTLMTGYPEVIYLPGYTEGIKVSADAAILIEGKTGAVLYAKNEHQRRAPASTTKIMTAILALERGDPEEIVTISRNAAYITGSSLYLRPGQKIKLGDLIKGMMLRSGNDSAVAIAEHIGGGLREFVNMMNLKARQLGAWNTKFSNPHGLPSANHYSTAFDLALISRYGLMYESFASIVSTADDTIEFEYPRETRHLSNTNKLLWYFEGADGVKTGTTSQAGHCLVASATRDGRRLIAVVLHSDNRWRDSANLLNYGFENFTLKDLSLNGEKSLTVEVKGGMAKDLKLVMRSEKHVVIKNSDLERYTVEYEIDSDRIIAPIKKGDILGRVVAKVGETELCSVDLVAERSVPKRTVFRTLLEKLGVDFSGEDFPGEERESRRIRIR